MKKLVVLAIGLVIFLTVILSLTSVSSKGNYVKIQSYTYSHTKAVCNSKNLCQDYEIFCKDQKIIKMNLITGSAVQFSGDWKDRRSGEMKNKFC